VFRAPKLLRVSFDSFGSFAVLDKLGMEPKRGVTLWVYELASDVEMVKMKFEKRSMNGKYPSACYRFIADQPGHRVCADTVRWKKWCLEKVNDA
jgi:hypothetical protein